MNRPRFYFKSYGRRSLSVVLAAFLVLIIAVSGVAPSMEGGSDDSLRQLVQDYIRKGKQQLDAGSYAESEKTFLLAQSYQEFLSSSAKTELRGLLERSQEATLGRERVNEVFGVVNELIKEGKLEEAKEELESIRTNKTITTEEQRQIGDVVIQLGSQIRKQKRSASSESVSKQGSPTGGRKSTVTRPSSSGVGARTSSAVSRAQSDLDRRRNAIAELYYRSMGFYKIGELKEARAGFIKVIASGMIPAKMARWLEGYVAEIDSRLGGKAGVAPVGLSRGDDAEILAIAEPKIPVFGGGGAGAVDKGIPGRDVISQWVDERGIADAGLVGQGPVDPVRGEGG